MVETPQVAGTVRLSPDVRAQVDAYAEGKGINYNAAMNILVREGLARLTTPEPKKRGAR